ncbi:MAG: endolytic transglycosylase MltG, partial [Nitrospirae bacterium]|nr:endolytic transglycosylase MltG [Nitrospirota bacterium]
IESIRAALYPADAEYLYFVSKNDGTHYFSNNLKEHNKAVAVYQKPLAVKKASR